MTSDLGDSTEAHGEAVQRPVRYMVSDTLTLDDQIARIFMTFPNRLSAAELEDVKAWFAVRVGSWQRHLLPEKKSDAAVQKPRTTASDLDHSEPDEQEELK